MSADTLPSRMANTERVLSVCAGVPVTVTVRGEKLFTFSTEDNGDQVAALDNIRQWFGAGVKSWESDYDADCDCTCAWVELA